jgi:hypothetical protein
MTTINYNYFFQVELLHKYFANGLCNDFSITPSVQTQSTLAGNKMLVKQYDNKLYTGVKVDDTGKVIDLPSASLQLTFFLKLNNPLFFNYTNLPFTFQPGKIYYFTNRNTNISNSKNFISQSVPYDNAKTYLPGDLAPDGTGVVFECISSCKGVVPSAANNTKWLQIDSNHYVSEADALQWLPSVSTFTFTTPQTSAVIDVFALNVTTKAFTNHIISKTIPFVQSVGSFKLDLSALSAGKYKLTVNGVTQMIYINDELNFKSVFAVIDIYNDTNLATGYKLLNGSSLLSPLYSINFLNRATIWKYILNTNSKGIITVNPAGFGFPAAAANVISSSSPIPLSETPLDISLALSTVNNTAVNINVPSVACASPARLTNFVNGTDKYACSEIFLNY